MPIESVGRLPSNQQRWYQWMSHNDAGPPVGALGHGWDGVDRIGMFPGEGPIVKPRFSGPIAPAAKARTMSLDELDHTLIPGSETYVKAQKYLEQLNQQSIIGQVGCCYLREISENPILVALPTRLTCKAVRSP